MKTRDGLFPLRQALIECTTKSYYSFVSWPALASSNRRLGRSIAGLGRRARSSPRTPINPFRQTLLAYLDLVASADRTRLRPYPTFHESAVSWFPPPSWSSKLLDSSNGMCSAVIMTASRSPVGYWLPTSTLSFNSFVRLEQLLFALAIANWLTSSSFSIRWHTSTPCF